MAARINRLNVRKAKTAPAGLYADGGNLYLRVRVSGSRSWVFRYKHGGDVREIGLGPLWSRPLAQARRLASLMRQALLDGKDPKSVLPKPQMASAPRTFAECAEQLIRAKRHGWRNAKHASQWQSTLRTYAFPVIGAMDVSQITVEHVLRCLTPIWTTKPETASRLRQRIEAVLDAAAAKGLRQGENPARWRGCLQALLPCHSRVRRVKHHPALPYLKVANFFNALRAHDCMAAQCLKFIILTACRSGEARLAKWGEIDFERALWIVPAERIKTGREHTVPLSGAALSLLSSLPKIEGCDLIFPSPRGGALSDMALTRLIRRMRGEWVDPSSSRVITVHGFRSTFRDWAGEMTHYPKEVIEHALAHRIPDKTEAAYARGTLIQKRRALMEDWASYVTHEACALDGKVVPLPARRARGAREEA